jgi:molybdopterin synthase sulfur carrier subunit
MKINVRLFAAAKEFAGSDAIEIELPAVCTASDLRFVIYERIPRLKAFGSQLRFAVDAEYANDSTPIHATSEVACIPPVSGG